MTDIERMKDAIRNSSHTVFFGGAGVSTESGIPDFRSVDGLYSQKYGNDSPETILSNTFFWKNPQKFWKFYWDKILMNGQVINPNPAHYKLAQLEAEGKLDCVVTQNIDCLHQQAGSKKVYQVHGTIASYHCCNCNKEYYLSDVLKDEGTGICPSCNSYLKPDVVLYEEPLPDEVWEASIRSIQKADVMIVAGTSLSVYPAANLLNFFTGQTLIFIDRNPELIEKWRSRLRPSDIAIQGEVGKIFQSI